MIIIRQGLDPDRSVSA